ncbi:hypothetical protein MNO14_07540 [Luteimonas sp. S4-F44]|uniref:hypothetical protein n=1 Tax=Luteimonas sp. S4-F44 TaxID=2925842 RepID=UPI001F539616|nr:hypothetical protein [Luteimonas sp. S4-F44]UNK43891.1 hypothetical protein MNO14_07540 [Luteimonas sp. S4-F44]
MHRFSIEIDAIGDQESDLLECLTCIDLQRPLDPKALPLIDRLVASGLVDRTPDGELALKLAGIERCKSLNLRVSSDTAARGVLNARRRRGV